MRGYSKNCNFWRGARNCGYTFERFFSLASKSKLTSPISVNIDHAGFTYQPKNEGKSALYSLMGTRLQETDCIHGNTDLTLSHRICFTWCLSSIISSASSSSSVNLWRVCEASFLSAIFVLTLLVPAFPGHVKQIRPGADWFGREISSLYHHWSLFRSLPLWPLLYYLCTIAKWKYRGIVFVLLVSTKKYKFWLH